MPRTCTVAGGGNVATASCPGFHDTTLLPGQGSNATATAVGFSVALPTTVGQAVSLMAAAVNPHSTLPVVRIEDANAVVQAARKTLTVCQPHTPLATVLL